MYILQIQISYFFIHKQIKDFQLHFSNNLKSKQYEKNLPIQTLVNSTEQKAR